MPRLQRRAPTVVGRRPRASRAVRGGFRGATRGYFVYRLFCKSRCVYTRRGSFSEADSNRDGRSNEARGPGVSEGACVGKKEPSLLWQKDWLQVVSSESGLRGTGSRPSARRTRIKDACTKKSRLAPAYPEPARPWHDPSSGVDFSIPTSPP